MLPVALNNRSQFPLHKQWGIPYLSRRLLLSGAGLLKLKEIDHIYTFTFLP